MTAPGPAENPAARSVPDDLPSLLSAVPPGWSRVVVSGRPYGLTRTEHADGRSTTIRAEELGGTDVVSANVWKVGDRHVLRPCEVPADRVLGFLRALRAGADVVPVGRAVPGWTPRPRPTADALTGRLCTVEVLTDAHLPGLHRALDLASPARTWAYYADGPFHDVDALAAWLARFAADAAAQPRVIVDRDGAPQGLACYLRTDPANGSIEVGAIVLSAALRRTTAATEAMALMMAHVFDDLGYRRYEWKCDDRNADSRRAAGRLGFAYEGTFRNAMVYRGRNRDTAWYAITDDDWPAIRGELRRWLAPENHDDAGRQRTPLRVEAALGRTLPRAPADR